MRRRFPFKFKIDGYKPEELKEIFIKKINDIKWKLDDSVNNKSLTEIFIKNKEEFHNFGGDVDNLILNCKFSHSRRIFGKHPRNRKKINKSDIDIGFERFISNKRKKDSAKFLENIYI